MIGGRVELVVSKRDSPVLTRTIGDPSPGTHVSSVASSSSQASPVKRPPLGEDSSSGTAKPPLPVERPTYVELPSPRSFTLDASASTASPSPSASPPTPFGPSHSRKSSTGPIVFEPDLEVLVVDDDPLTRMLMQRLLTRLGCKVSTAENGEMALEMILRSNFTSTTENSATQPISKPNLPKGDGDTKFHVIFLDNQMPILSGLKTIEKLREIGRGDFVVGVTGT
jgi:osomolarity two-component system, sensor histidine kinase SLN1